MIDYEINRCRCFKSKIRKKTDMNDPRGSFDSIMLAKIMISILDEVPTAKERDKGQWKILIKLRIKFTK